MSPTVDITGELLPLIEGRLTEELLGDEMMSLRDVYATKERGFMEMRSKSNDEGVVVEDSIAKGISEVITDVGVATEILRRRGGAGEVDGGVSIAFFFFFFFLVCLFWCEGEE